MGGSHGNELGSYPIFNHMPGVQAFEDIRNILDSYEGISDLSGQESDNLEIRNDSGQNGNPISGEIRNQVENGNQIGAGSQGETGNQIGTGSWGITRNMSGSGSGNTGSQYSSPRQKMMDFVNNRFPKIIKFTCKFVIGIVKTFIYLGR